MSEQHRPIVIRRRRRAHVAHHGGAWKIALADFMTALMALFLVLWIISTASPAELQGLAEYFRTPLKVALADGDRNSSSTSAIPGGGADPDEIAADLSRLSPSRRRAAEAVVSLREGFVAAPAGSRPKAPRRGTCRRTAPSLRRWIRGARADCAVRAG